MYRGRAGEDRDPFPAPHCSSKNDLLWRERERGRGREGEIPKEDR